MAVVIEHGIPRNGITAERPTNAHSGALFFDETIGCQLVWRGAAGWSPASTPYGTTGARPAASDVPIGQEYFNTTSDMLEISDGVTWLEYAVADNLSSSSLSTSSSSTSSTSSSSTSSSSTSSSSTSSSSTSSSSSS